MDGACEAGVERFSVECGLGLGGVFGEKNQKEGVLVFARNRHAGTKHPLMSRDSLVVEIIDVSP